LGDDRGAVDVDVLEQDVFRSHDSHSPCLSGKNLTRLRTYHIWLCINLRPWKPELRVFQMVNAIGRSTSFLARPVAEDLNALG
jgi:hypothetical protein